MTDPILHVPTDVSAQWLSPILAADVTITAVEPLESGLISPIARVRIEGEGGSSAVIVKCAPLEEDRRSRFHLIGRTECLFYREIGKEVGVSVPHCWHAAFREADGRYTLVLEDVYPKLPGSVEAGMTGPQVRAAVDVLAALHSRHWRKTDRWPWLGDRFTKRVENFASNVAPTIPGVIARYGEQLRASVAEMLPRAPELYSAEVMRIQATAALTLSHGDFDARNIAFGGDPSDLVVFDWQAAMANSPAIDLSKLIVGSLTIERRRELGSGLLNRYTDGMRRKGVDVSDSDVRRFVHEGLIERLMAGCLIMIGAEAASATERTILLGFDRVGAALDDGW